MIKASHTMFTWYLRCQTIIPLQLHQLQPPLSPGQEHIQLSSTITTLFPRPVPDIQYPTPNSPAQIPTCLPTGNCAHPSLLPRVRSDPSTAPPVLAPSSHLVFLHSMVPLSAPPGTSNQSIHAIAVRHSAPSGIPQTVKFMHGGRPSHQITPSASSRYHHPSCCPTLRPPRSFTRPSSSSLSPVLLRHRPGHTHRPARHTAKKRKEKRKNSAP